MRTEGLFFEMYRQMVSVVSLKELQRVSDTHESLCLSASEEYEVRTHWYSEAVRLPFLQ